MFLHNFMLMKPQMTSMIKTHLVPSFDTKKWSELKILHKNRDFFKFLKGFPPPKLLSKKFLLFLKHLPTHSNAAPLWINEFEIRQTKNATYLLKDDLLEIRIFFSFCAQKHSLREITLETDFYEFFPFLKSIFHVEPRDPLDIRWKIKNETHFRVLELVTGCLFMARKSLQQLFHSFNYQLWLNEQLLYSWNSR